MTLPDLTRLARELESSDPHDRGTQQQNLGRLRELRTEVRRGEAPELAVCLGAVSQLLEALTGPRDSIDRDQIKGIACRMLYALGNDLGGLTLSEGGEPPAIVHQERHAPPPPASEAPVPTPAAKRPSPAAQARPTVPKSPVRKKEAVPQMPKRADMSFGRMLVELGHVTRKQVADALRFHRAKGPRIGECLLLQGAISPEHLLNALKIQDLLRTTPQGISPETLARYKKVEEPGPAERARAQDGASAADRRVPDALAPTVRDAPQRVTEGIFFGEVLLGAEMITNEELEKAIHLHHKTGIHVGEALIQLGVLTEEDVQAGLELQKQLRRIAGSSAA